MKSSARRPLAHDHEVRGTQICKKENKKKNLPTDKIIH